MLATRNSVPGASLGYERVVRLSGVEYRLWNHAFDKLACGLRSGLTYTCLPSTLPNPNLTLNGS